MGEWVCWESVAESAEVRRSTYTGTEHPCQCSGVCMEQSTKGLREGTQPGAGDAWMMVGWQPSCTRPFVEVPKDKVEPRGTSAADMHAADRDRCIASKETAARWRCAEIHPRAHEVKTRIRILDAPRDFPSDRPHFRIHFSGSGTSEKSYFQSIPEMRI